MPKNLRDIPRRSLQNLHQQSCALERSTNPLLLARFIAEQLRVAINSGFNPSETEIINEIVTSLSTSISIAEILDFEDELTFYQPTWTQLDYPLVKTETKSVRTEKTNNKFKKSETKPKESLIIELLQNLEIDLTQCNFSAGKKAANTFNAEGYKQIYIPSLCRSILFSNAINNHTFIISNPQNPNVYNGLNKAELKSKPNVSYIKWTENHTLWLQKIKQVLLVDSGLKTPETEYFTGIYSLVNIHNCLEQLATLIGKSIQRITANQICQSNFIFNGQHSNGRTFLAKAGMTILKLSSTEAYNQTTTTFEYLKKILNIPNLEARHTNYYHNQKNLVHDLNAFAAQKGCTVFELTPSKIRFLLITSADKVELTGREYLKHAEEKITQKPADISILEYLKMTAGYLNSIRNKKYYNTIHKVLTDLNSFLEQVNRSRKKPAELADLKPSTIKGISIICHNNEPVTGYNYLKDASKVLKTKSYDQTIKKLIALVLENYVPKPQLPYQYFHNSDNIRTDLQTIVQAIRNNNPNAKITFKAISAIKITCANNITVIGHQYLARFAKAKLNLTYAQTKSSQPQVSEALFKASTFTKQELANLFQIYLNLDFDNPQIIKQDLDQLKANTTSNSLNAFLNASATLSNLEKLTGYAYLCRAHTKLNPNRHNRLAFNPSRVLQQLEQITATLSNHAIANPQSPVDPLP